MFTQDFQKYDFPLLGLVRLPEVKIEDKLKLELGLDKNCSNYNFLRFITISAMETNKHKLSEENLAKYYERMEYELGIFEELGFTDYVLLVWKVINKLKELGGFVDYGRGSCAGSFVFALLGITGVLDVIEKGLIFERFISKVRSKKQKIGDITYLYGDLLCDADLNLGNCRQPIIDWLKEEYKGKVCKIAALSTLTGKILIKDVYKSVNEVSEDEAKRVADLIEKHFGIVEDIEKMPEKNDEFKAWSKQYPETFNIALQLRDLLRQKSSHASGYFISYYDLDGYAPLELNKDKELSLAYEMNDASKLGVKLDLLGLTQNAILTEFFKTIPEKVEDIELDNNPIIYNALQGDFLPYGLYQISADCARRVTNKIKPKNILELSDINAIARPGALDYLDSYVDGTAESPHKVFDDIIKNNRNLFLYQEDLMKAIVAVGFTLDDAEIVRKCVTGDTMFVSDKRGWISIDQLRREGYEGEKFLVMGENGVQSWGKIKDIWSNGIHQVRYVETKNGLNIKATKHHQFLTDKGWKSRANLIDGKDSMVCANITSFTGHSPISDDLAIVIVGLVTEGYFTSYNQCHFTNYDKEVMGFFRAHFLNEFGELPHFLKDNEKVCFVKRAFATKINKYLSYGLSASKYLPKEILQLKEDISKKIVAFLYNCEGSFYSSSHPIIEFSSASIKLVEQVQLLLLRFGVTSFINTTFNKRYKQNYYKLIISDYNNQMEFKKNFFEFLSKAKQNDFEKNIIHRDGKINQNCIPKYIVRKFLNQYSHTLDEMASGSVYCEDISKNKFEILCEKSKNLKWINFCKGKQFYSLLKNTKRDIREVEVFDFSMEDENSPYIVANGMVIHNCVGKKLVKEAKEWEFKIKNKVKENNLPDEISGILWKVLEQSSKYSFNKSHSLATAKLGALTVWAKYKYPLQFYTACLNSSKDLPNPIEEISLIEKELLYFNIKLLPPHILKSKEHFTIEDGNIRYSIQSIKGISSKTLEKLKNFCHPYSNKFEIFSSASEIGLNVAATGNIIAVGAMDDYLTKESRANTILELNLYNLLTPREQQRVIELSKDFNYNLIDIIKYLSKLQNGTEKPFIKPSRLDTLRKNFEPYNQIYKQNSKNEELLNWKNEKDFLGFSYSHKLFDILKKTYPDIMSLYECSGELNDSKVLVGGIVTEFRSGTSRNKNKYIKIKINDDSGKQFDAMLMERYFDNNDLNNNNTIDIGDIVMVSGKKASDIIFCDKMINQNIKIYNKKSDLKEK